MKQLLMQWPLYITGSALMAQSLIKKQRASEQLGITFQYDFRFPFYHSSSRDVHIWPGGLFLAQDRV